MIEGMWHKDDVRRVFVAGARWWELKSTGFSMWPSDQRLAEAEATRRYASKQGVEPDLEKMGFCLKCGMRPCDCENVFGEEKTG